MGGIRWEGRIPNQPLREAVLAVLTDEFTYSEICYRIGWTRQYANNGSIRPTAETAGLKRCLGIDSTRNKNRKSGVPYVTFVSTIDIDRAISIAKAIGVDIDELYEGKLPDEQIAGLCEECDAPLLKPDPEGICGMCREELALFGKVAVAA